MTQNDCVGYRLRTLTNLIRRFFLGSSHHQSIRQVTGNNGWIIGFLTDHAHEPIFQKDIENHFQLTRSAVSRVLDRMERQALIRREPVESDHRLKRIVLTEKSMEISSYMNQDREHLEAILLKGFTEEERAQLIHYLQRMQKNVTESVEQR